MGSTLAESKLAKNITKKLIRESAYEMLNKKIEIAEAEEAKAKAKEEREALKRAASKKRSTSTRRRSTRQHPLVKVLTSATVIRGVLGILSKMIK